MLFWITSELFLPLLFKEFSNPKLTDILETQLPSFHRTPPLWQEGGLKFPFYVGGSVSSFVIAQPVQDQTNVCETGKEIFAKHCGWDECFL